MLVLICCFLFVVFFYTVNLNRFTLFYFVKPYYTFFTNINFTIKTILITTKLHLLKNTSILPKYYLRNENIWVDGFLLDFLQKKSADLWVRKFVIYTGFLFSERLVFDSVIRIYLDNLLWPLHYVSTFEANNVLEMLLLNIYLYFLFFILIVLIYIFLF